MSWFRFYDLHSGGGTKVENYQILYIEAESQKEAESVFYNRYGFSPYRVSCSCCGEDYSVFGIKKKNIAKDAVDYGEGKYLIIHQDEITDEERKLVKLPEEGWVWK